MTKEALQVAEWGEAHLGPAVHGALKVGEAAGHLAGVRVRVSIRVRVRVRVRVTVRVTVRVRVRVRVRRTLTRTCEKSTTRWPALNSLASRRSSSWNLPDPG